MDKATRIFLALALAGATVNFAACGDDEDKPAADGDDGSDGEGDPADGSDGTDNDGDDDGEPGDGDGGVEPAPECPTHPQVEEMGEFCVLKEGTMVDDLEVGPVEGKKWALQGKLIVGEDVGGEAEPNADADTATITFLPGTTVYGDNSKLSYLVISRGSKIIAEGEKDAPIVFTALSDDKAPKAWGGIAINGRAKATCGTTCTAEGEAGLYGGQDDADNSGVLSYVRVEWSGFEFAPGDELNGITFAAVGSGTQLDHIQVHYSGDDGLEWFGGTAQAKYLVVSGPSDDGLDWQLGYRGKVQHAVVIQPAGAGEHGIEADNVENNADLEPISSPTFANVTIVGNGDSGQDGVRLRRGTKGALHSFLVTNFTASCLNVADTDTAARLPDELSIDGSRVSCPVNFKDEPTQTMFFEAGTGNMTLASVTDELTSVDIANPDPRLKAGSALLTGGSKVAGDTFFDQVDHIGAFNDADNWMEGWTSFPAPSEL